jgi:[ribosomal protein S18]-alanine N-acetyltransferase
LSIRALELRDVAPILAIQSACPEIAQWTARDYERVAQGEMAGWVFEAQNKPIGFLVGRRVASEMEILNFAVRPDDRCRGAGGALLDSALDWARSFSAEHAILEVRSANETALRFYEHHKFQIVGRRRNYYNSPNDDALLLTLNLA